MNECHHYGCDAAPDVYLKAWGPGEIRGFCDEHAEVRRSVSGYTTKGVDQEKGVDQ